MRTRGIMYAVACPKWFALCAIFYALSISPAGAQSFYNLTADEVRIDSVLPRFSCAIPLGGAYQDSVYTVSVAYPEYINMSIADISRYQQITDAELPSQPVVSQHLVIDRKKGILEVSFVPLVKRKGKYQKLVSFMLDVKAHPIAAVSQGKKLQTRASAGAESRYAAHSVLASGTWVKIRIPQSGIYQLTDALLSRAGFSDAAKVRVFGYGGALQPESLTDDYLTATDDLKEVPICTVGGRRLFYAQGPVSWESPTATVRTRNPYSNYGYYFLTQDGTEPMQADSAAFTATFYPAGDDYHTLHEVDDYAWYEGGRKLYQDDPVSAGQSRTYTLQTPGLTNTGTFSVAVSSASGASVTIALNDSVVGTLSMSSLGEYEHGKETSAVYRVSNIQAENTVSLTTTATSSTVRLDYLSLCFGQPRPLPRLSTTSFPVPEYVGRVANQDRHADEACDMVIIVPASGKLTAQAERIKALHEEQDTMRVRIVVADELYNEFSSGTPDANAYRRYLKMLYDRAATDSDMPRYLLLFGDCAWDNRMLTSVWQNVSPDDFLLCYESDNSLSSTHCYVSDDYFCLLDDGEVLYNGGNDSYMGRPDIAVGRFPVRTADQAKVMVDKTVSYVLNRNAGSWQNVVMVMGDDGNNNIHMDDANKAAAIMETANPGLVVKKVMWDSYTREMSATGATYPEVTKVIKQQQAAGALVMDYCGHGRADMLSHEGVLKLADFEQFTNTNLPLWITASCDIMPFDGQTDNIGETAVLSDKGGAVAFFGTTRTVYRDRNQAINNAYLRQLFSRQNGRLMTLGEAQRLAKNELVTSGTDRTQNKLQYSLLGDPAIALNVPVHTVVVDSINGQALATAANPVTLKAGSVVTVKGHIEKDAAKHTTFNGTVTAVVRDSEEQITCKLNNTTEEGAETAFVYTDRVKTLFSGTDRVTNGTFTFSFAVPMDINYTNETGLLNLYAVSSDATETANGSCDRFVVGGTSVVSNDSIGPSVYCYLNSPSFTNGDVVNATPYFVAEITDKDGINTAGNGIGHDLELVIDGNPAQTYVLNDYFQYDFGSYTSGTVAYSIPQLSDGPHRLRFRAWDMLNNATTTELAFTVAKGTEPNFFSVACTRNPATTQTTFIVSHDRTGSEMEVEIDVFDFSGRQLWRHTETTVPTSGTYTFAWDLTVDGGRRLQTGVYLYRVRISSDGGSSDYKSQKLIVIGNK